MLAIHVRLGSKRSGVTGLHGDRLKVRVAAPAVEGRANDALIMFVAERLGVARNQVTLVKGEHSRDKLLLVPSDCDPTRLLA